MPNRILREGILTSRRVNMLSEGAEIFYRRLMSVVDDYGRYYADPALLLAACYPFRTAIVTIPQVERYLIECQAANLARIYSTTSGARFVELIDFRQQIRAVKSKFPAPDDVQCTCAANATQTHSTRDIGNAHLDVDVDVDVDVDGVEGEKGNVELKLDGSPPEKQTEGQRFVIACRVLDFLNEKTGRRYQRVKANLELIRARLRDGATETELRQVVARKCREWKGDATMAIYLRPATLFNRTKFAQYQGELVIDGGKHADDK